ncbi:MAG: hypothetical protein JWP06_41 [Candidatus Saccharibacteria bacterium]|nr:hypothetical protein [Candidatus Saccharibacteria bacterium]
MSRISRKKLIGIVVAGLAALGIATALVLPSTGADFTASDIGTVNVSTATLSLSLSDDSGSSGTFDLNFTNLAPGAQQVRNFYVKNTGSIAANVKIGNPVSGVVFTAPAGQTPDPAQLKFGVDGYLALTPATSIGTSIPLGSIGAGETKGYTLRVSLDQAAGNNWQGVSVGATATVTLNQQ